MWGLGCNAPDIAGWWVIAAAGTMMARLDATRRRPSTPARRALPTTTLGSAVALALIGAWWLIDMRAWEAIAADELTMSAIVAATAVTGLAAMEFGRRKHR